MYFNILANQIHVTKFCIFFNDWPNTSRQKSEDNYWIFTGIFQEIVKLYIQSVEFLRKERTIRKQELFQIFFLRGGASMVEKFSFKNPTLFVPFLIVFLRPHFNTIYNIYYCKKCIYSSNYLFETRKLPIE